MTSKIDWCDETINVFTGCHGNCSWCYARRMAARVPSVIVFDHDSRGRRDSACHASTSPSVREAEGIGVRIPRRGRLLWEADYDMPLDSERGANR
jgi:protein gp37